MKPLLRYLAIALCILMAPLVVFAQAACSEGQLPYEVQGHAAATPQAACAMWATAEGFGGYDWEAPSSCTVDGFTDTVVKVCEPPPVEASAVNCYGTCTLVIKPEPLTDEKVQDMGNLFWAFVAALVVLWGSKQLLNLFTGDNNGGA